MRNNDEIKRIKQELIEKYNIKTDRDLIQQLGIREEEKSKLFAWIRYQCAYSYREGFENGQEEYNGSKVENQYIPSDAHSFEVFSIKDSEDSPTRKRAFIGFKLENGNFHFIGVPYTEPINKEQSCFSKFLKSFKEQCDNVRKALVNMFFVGRMFHDKKS